MIGHFLAEERICAPADLDLSVRRMRDLQAGEVPIAIDLQAECVVRTFVGRLQKRDSGLSSGLGEDSGAVVLGASAPHGQVLEPTETAQLGFGIDLLGGRLVCGTRTIIPGHLLSSLAWLVY